ncbi:MAG: UDP-N-acetylmuramoyl-tripeptide--D-alanyl-D-alanine ligase [Carboxylicivirga sp.]|jgi:UDP-N-acetylmuramoyl-tripeptide--D-alanyl-D-alanine ligase|nr:UDP-N-acetylmuramoyl-tripeptide--D-alanyl-D-alanine ligase [Carboxylicivirga sp.]
MSQIATIHQAYLSSNGISTDSRKDNTNYVFFALKGESFDGNKYVNEVLQKGASYAVADDQNLKGTENVFIVDNVLETLQELARYHRRYLNIPIIGITGTNGKTTTKELVAAVLSRKFKISATKGNFNNHIGVPLTILQMDQSIELGIVEMGANHVGEIKDLCKIAEPNYGLITNVGKAHLEGFGSFEGVKTAKGELYQYLNKNNGLIFINADNSHLNLMANGISKRIEYGISSGEITGDINIKSPFISINWQLKTGETHRSQTKLIGAYNLENVLSAICIGNFLGVSEEDINHAIEGYAPTNNRSQFIQSKTNQIIMDAYNANPSSMQVALQNFAEVSAQNKTLILGGMKELGGDSFEEHKKLVELIITTNSSRTLLVGDEFKDFESVSNNIEFYPDTDALIQGIKRQAINNAYVLIKGSRSNKLEDVLPHL